MTLKDKDGKPLYPVTSAKAVIDSKGVDVESRLATKQDALVDSEDIEVEGNGLTVTERVKRLWARDRWRTILSRFPGLPTYAEDVANTLDDGSQYGLYGEVFPYQEALQIIESSNINPPSSANIYSAKMLRGSTLFPLAVSGNAISCSLAFHQCAIQKVLGVCGSAATFSDILPNNCLSMFHSCLKLERIVGTLNLTYLTASGNVGNMFAECIVLREVRIKNLKVSLSLNRTPYLSLASLQYLIANAANTTAITITVQSAVYAKITGADGASYGDDDPEDWHALLDAALAKNISFAM